MERHLPYAITVLPTCRPTQVNVPRINPSRTGWYLIYLLLRDKRPSWPW